jgi:hypothetical protein
LGAGRCIPRPPRDSSTRSRRHNSPNHPSVANKPTESRIDSPHGFAGIALAPIWSTVTDSRAFDRSPIFPSRATWNNSTHSAKRPTPDAVRRALDDAKITALPQSPNGAHIAADLLSFYFTSSDANDLCYQARIGRDACRGLDGSDRPPLPLA